ncbi:MAG: DUF1028 domain-containing protein [Pseudomonadota bacterium]
MTFSILVCDRKSGALAGAAATGSLCVGGWVLRGGVASGLVASQGTAPSTFWRDDILRRMEGGATADQAVATVTGADPGRGYRQVIALDQNGGTGAHTGADSVAFAGHKAGADMVVAGNMLAGAHVLDALLEGFLAANDTLPDRLISALRAAELAGGDSRGLQSAALLMLSPDAPPLDLRIDHAADPVPALADLLARTRAQPYSGWLDVVPVSEDRTRAPAPARSIDAAES